MIKTILKKSNKILAYLFFAVFCIYQILCSFGLVENNQTTFCGSFVLLALGLIAMLNVINEVMSYSHPILENAHLNDGIKKVICSTRKHKKLRIIANDGIGYLQVISDEKPSIELLELIIFKEDYVNRYKRLCEKGIIKQLEIKKLSSRPSFHMCLGDGNNMMLGSLVDDASASVASYNFTIENYTKDSQKFFTCFDDIFNDLWAIGTFVYDSSTET